MSKSACRRPHGQKHKTGENRRTLLARSLRASCREFHSLCFAIPFHYENSVNASPTPQSRSENAECGCGWEFWWLPRRIGQCIPAAGCAGRTNAGRRQKNRRRTIPHFQTGSHAPPSPSTQTQETSAPLQTIRAVLERNFRMAEEVLEQGEAESAGNIRSDLGCVRQRSHGPKDPCSIPEINFENRSNLLIRLINSRFGLHSQRAL